MCFNKEILKWEIFKNKMCLKKEILLWKLLAAVCQPIATLASQLQCQSIFQKKKIAKLRRCVSRVSFNMNKLLFIMFHHNFYNGWPSHQVRVCIRAVSQWKYVSVIDWPTNERTREMLAHLKRRIIKILLSDWVALIRGMIKSAETSINEQTSAIKMCPPYVQF